MFDKSASHNQIGRSGRVEVDRLTDQRHADQSDGKAADQPGHEGGSVKDDHGFLLGIVPSLGR